MDWTHKFERSKSLKSGALVELILFSRSVVVDEIGIVQDCGG